MVAEIALALVLLVGAGLLINSLLRLQKVNLGFDPHHVLTFRLDLPDTRYSGAQPIVDFYHQLQSQISQLPGVQSVGAISTLPLSGHRMFADFAIDRRQFAPGELPQSLYSVITPGYFRTMGIPLLKGRDFTARDDMKAPRVVIISETLARQFFPNEDPIGKRIAPMISSGDGRVFWREIIGVVGNVKSWGLSADPGPQVYLPQAQFPSRSLTLVVRTGMDLRGLIAPVQNEVRALDKDLAVHDVRTLDRYLSEWLAEPRFNTLLLGVFAGIALILTAVGIYGMLSYSIVQRTHEIGVRMALGARQNDILKLVLGQGMTLVLIGTSIGLLASLALVRFLSSLLYGVSPTDPVTYVIVSLVLAEVALLASYFPARRAMKLDPMVTLRYE